MPNVVSYLCDQNIRMCRDYCRMGLSDCRHTFDPDHAKNGKIEPELVLCYPDRFAFVETRVHSKSGYHIDYYEEKETQP